MGDQSRADHSMNSNDLLSCLLLLAISAATTSGAYTPGDYSPGIGQGPPTDYGRPNTPNCHMEQKTEFIDKCLPYVETTCYSQNEEDCKGYHVTTCTPEVNTEVDRRCFNVTELICELVESVHYRQVEESFHVQSCYTTKDRICDTVHEIDTTTKDDLQCIELETPNCHMEDKILVDKVCTDTYEFECSPDKKLDNAGYGVKDTVCKKVPKHDCYDSPRTVQVRCASPSIAATATSSPRTFPSQWSDRTATSNARRSASWCPRLSQRRPRSTPTPRTAKRSLGRFVTSARQRRWSQPAFWRPGCTASTPRSPTARRRTRSTATSLRSPTWSKCAITS